MVMATDIMNESPSQARKDRWALAFSESSGYYSSNQVELKLERHVNRRATVVLEHVIQASDVSQTMQKLKECGVFGVSSEEYLNFAKTIVRNGRRREEKWQQRWSPSSKQFLFLANFHDLAQKCLSC